MKALVVFLIVLLAVLHQDFWWWDSREMLFGFLPVGLAWHAFISLAAGLVGLLAVKTCWPAGLEHDDPNAIIGSEDGGGDDGGSARTDAGAGGRG